MVPASVSENNESNDLKPYLDTLVSKRRIGFAWLDDELTVKQCFGELSEWIPIGKNICSATPLFWGMNSDLLHLQDEPDCAVIIPKVGLKTSWDDSTKLSIEIMWAQEDNKYIVTLYNISSQSDLDHELAKQVRARRIAEENYQAAKKQANEQQGLLGLIMDHAPAAVAIFDHNMKFRFTTKNWLELFALEGEPVIGRSFYDTCPGREEDRSKHQDCLQGKHITLEIEKMRNGNGKMEWVRLDLQPWKNKNNTIGGIIIVADVLTQLIEKRKELEQKNTDLARANQELEEFTSIVSHDLKSPLRVITSKANEIQQIQNSPHVDQILQQSDRMSSMLDDLFEYSHIHRRSEKILPTNIQNIIQNIIPTIANSSNSKFQHQTLDVTLEIPVAPFDLIMRNLIENAIRHNKNDTGTIILELNEMETEWHFSITDDGPGIPLELQTKIFQPFQTGYSSETGNGIGLALVKKMVDLHGGNIWLESNPDKNVGAKFMFTWPKYVSTI